MATETPTRQRLVAHRETCDACQNGFCETGDALAKAWRISERRNQNARARNQAYADAGMVRVTGGQGGVYYE